MTSPNTRVEAAAVQIVAPTDGWVLERLGGRLGCKLPYAALVPWAAQRGGEARLAYYVNYALYQGPSGLPDVGFFTHLDESHEFLERARRLDYCVCMSRVYADWLREHGVATVCHIPMGFDYYRYRSRLVLGVVGRLDHPRKGAHLVNELRKLPFVEVLTTEGRFAEDELRDLYQRIDYVLIPATVEGGPMSLLEGLAMGKPVIAPDGVGMVAEFGETPHIRTYAAGDLDALLAVVKACHQAKCERTRLVQDRTWDRWAEDHHRPFRRLLRERGCDLPEPAAGFRFGMMTELELEPGNDAGPLEAAVDRAARDLYYGRYGAARSGLQEMRGRYPCVRKLLESIL